MLSAHQVRNKQRAAVRRREDDIEEDEITSGELNLIPYLDIVTNLMLFLLASVTAIIILGQLNTTLPDRGPPPTNASTPDQNPDTQPLKIMVSVTKDKIVVWSLTKLEGTLAEPKDTIARTGQIGAVCDGAYMCETNQCNNSGKCEASDQPVTPVFDYRQLNKTLYEIAKRHYAGKHRAQATYEAMLQADGTIPYGTIVSIMAAMRCKMPALYQEPGGCFLPAPPNDATKKAANGIDDGTASYDTDKATYDPDKMSLFGDIIFSTGFE
jgi:biopolymer transport protein ExbD